MSDFNWVVLGTSIMWGQGLADPDKIHSVLKHMLQERFIDRPVNVTFLAHSGASTGYEPNGSVDTHQEPRVDGEVPALYPTILQEIEEFDGLGIRPESIDVVLLDAGINDVHATKVIDPRTSSHQIEEWVEIYCHQHMVLLVGQLLTKFERARIIIAGYYEFLTEQSEAGYIHTLAKALGTVPGGIIFDTLIGVTEGWLKRRLLVNCDTFAARSLAAFRQTADEVNRRLDTERVFVACPDIKPENAAFASDPWLFGINDDLSPQDPLAAIRAKACQSANLSRPKEMFCKIASAGHPNAEGAKAYARAIFALVSDWAQP
jgi:lysophospholipase L1-like esterase